MSLSRISDENISLLTHGTPKTGEVVRGSHMRIEMTCVWWPKFKNVTYKPLPPLAIELIPDGLVFTEDTSD